MSRDKEASPQAPFPYGFLAAGTCLLHSPLVQVTKLSRSLGRGCPLACVTEPCTFRQMHTSYLKITCLAAKIKPPAPTWAYSLPQLCGKHSASATSSTQAEIQLQAPTWTCKRPKIAWWCAGDYEQAAQTALALDAHAESLSEPQASSLREPRQLLAQVRCSIDVRSSF